MFEYFEMILLIVGLLALVLAGIHVAVALGAVAVRAVYMMHRDLAVVANFVSISAIEVIREYVLAVIPLFMLMGELLARCGELCEVVRERVRERAQGAWRDTSARALKLGDREVVLLCVFLQLSADNLDAPAESTAKRVEELLAAHTARVPQNNIGVGCWTREIVQGLSDERVGALLNPRHANKPRLAKQRGARHRQQLPRSVLVCFDVAQL